MHLPTPRYNLVSKINFLIYQKMRRMLGKEIIPYIESNPEKMMKILKN